MRQENLGRIYVAGHRGMVGAAVQRAINQSNDAEGLVSGSMILRDRSDLDLRCQADVNAFFALERPDTVVFCAARVGGIHANNEYPAQFIYDNLAMAANTIHAAYQNGVQRFLFLGSTCIYPREAPQPMAESCLLSGPLEITNEAYAIAKIAGLKMCQFYRRQYGVLYHSAMPTNLFGPGDNYHPKNSHVLPALIRRFHEAKEDELPEVTIWGTGEPRREFLHVDDLAQAILHLLTLTAPPDWVNVGSGKDISIKELSALVAEIIGYRGSIVYDLSKPDGTLLKRTDTTLISESGWEPQIGLREGIVSVYQDFLAEHSRQTIRER